MDQLNIYGQICNVFHVDGAQVGIFQEASQVILCCFLQHHDHMHLEVQVISPTFVGYFVYQLHKGTFANEELSAFLALMDLTESHHPWLVLLGPLHETFLGKLCGGISSHSEPDTTG